MANNIATASDVRIEIDTDLSDSEITSLIERTVRDIEREYDTSSVYEDTDHQRDFEATLTALRIASGRDRRARSESVGSLRVDYEGDEIDALKTRVSRLDPGDAFTPGTTGGVRRNTDRYSRSVSRSDE